MQTQCQGHCSRSWDLPFSVFSIPPLLLEGLSLIFCQMFISVRRCAKLMTQLLRLKVMEFALEFCISYVPLKGFSLMFGQMFISVWRCAEPMTQLTRLKVKVTVQSNRIYPWICVRSLSLSPSIGFSFYFGQMFICRIHDSATQTQGHTFRSWHLPLNFVASPYLLYHWKDLY